MKEALALKEEVFPVSNVLTVEPSPANVFVVGREFVRRLVKFFDGAFRQPTQMSHLAKEKWLLQKYEIEEVQRKFNRA